MKFRSILAAALLAMASIVPAAATAQPSTPASDSAERLALAKQMLQEMDLAHNMHGMMEKMFSAMPLPKSKEFDAEQYGKSMGAGIEAAMPQIVSDSAQAYADTFTSDELKQYVAFYASPAGQALLKKLPELTQRTMPAVMASMPKMLAVADADYCAHVKCDDVVKGVFKQQEDMVDTAVAQQAVAQGKH